MCRFTRARLRTLQNGTFRQLCRFVVKGEMPAECAVGHGKHDRALPVCVTRSRHRLFQHGTDHAAAADEHRGRDQHQKERQHDDKPCGLRPQLVPP
jgi:hypothetical protein